MEAIVANLYATYDSDKDGTLNRNEVLEFFYALKTKRADLGLSEDKFDEWFNSIDKDHDGTVCPAEFTDYLNSINYTE